MSATKEQANEFISKIAPLIQKYAKEYGYKVASPIIAQSCLESGFNTTKLGYKYNNFFGMKCGSSWKGKSVNLSTKEEYTVGTITTIKDNFRVYDSMEEGVKGYFEFISRTRYANLKDATSAQQYLENIKNDGYATDSSYVTKNMKVVTVYGLEKYDDFSSKDNSGIYFDKYTGNSSMINEVLKSIGVNSNWIGDKVNRLNIAVANGINDYSGLLEQNLSIIKLALNGTLKRGNYKTTTDVNCRDNSNKSGNIVKVIKSGEFLSIIDIINNEDGSSWAKLTDGSGYVSCKCIEKV